MRIAVLNVVIIAVLWAGSYCEAKTVYGDVNGPNEPGAGSYQDPYRRIQDAIDSVDGNDIIIVAEGRYYENIFIETSNIVLRSTDPNDTGVVANTIIDGNGIDSAVTFGIECYESVLSGFTITNGHATYGGAIYCKDDSRPRITNCTVVGNTATGYGGGIYCFNGSNPIITNCIIADNSAGYGGAIACLNADPAIANCAIINNSADYGGGLVSVAGEAIITNCTIANNTVNNNGSSLACNSPPEASPGNVQIINCILWNGGGEIWNNDGSTIAVSYSDVNGGWPGDGNINADPLLEADNYHLTPASPCKDTAETLYDHNDQTDIDGRRRVVGACVDMGCDEFLRVGDLDYDEHVNLADLVIFAPNWLQTGSGRTADFNRDKVVDFADFASLAENWLW